MSAKDFRRFGREVVDWIADYLETIDQRPVLAQIEPGDLKEKLPSSAPVEGEAMSEILADVDRLIVPALTHWNHPMFFALFATSSSAPGVFGEMLSAAFDVKAMLWRTSPASTELEEVALSWLRQMMNLPAEFDGIIYDTASISTMHALAAAREMLGVQVRELGMSGRTDLPLLRVYASAHAHSSIEKGIITLGLGQRALVKVPADTEYRLDVNGLRRAIEEDKSNGLLPFCVVATIGTTSSASIDPVEAIAEICDSEKLWLHVDAAYAGSAAIVPELRYIMRGASRADSLVVNPHKWLFTPFDLSVLYSRRLDVLKRAFSIVPEYLKTSETVRNQMDYGIQLGRRFRSLKLWMVLRYFGQEGLAARIREQCRLAKLFASWIQESPYWDLLAPVNLGLVCFRYNPRGLPEEMSEEKLNALNESIMKGVNFTGRAYISHTKLHDKLTLRLSIGNIRNSERHVREVWKLIKDSAAEATSSA